MDKRKQQQKKAAPKKGATKQGISAKAKKQKGQGELSDKDLDKVAGGTGTAWSRV
jgi:hypothetical protein